jgi:WD40 repeat protein
VAFSPDGQHIVSGSSDQTIGVWNAMTGEVVAGPFRGHSQSVKSVTFSPDGQHIVSGSIDHTIRLWKVMARETEISGQVDFTDQSKMNHEGWICGSNGEPLMWIPPLHRTGLHRPSNVWVAAEHEICLDLSNFKHGNSWSTCINT